MTTPVGPHTAAARALQEIADELRRMNEGRDQFHREVLEVLTQAKNYPPSKGFGYYAEDPSEMCTARSHPDRRAWHRCLRMANHEGLHEDGMGNAFAEDQPGRSAPSASAQGVET